jgi:hypothetical protein
MHFFYSQQSKIFFFFKQRNTQYTPVCLYDRILFYSTRFDFYGQHQGVRIRAMLIINKNAWSTAACSSSEPLSVYMKYSCWINTLEPLRRVGGFASLILRVHRFLIYYIFITSMFRNNIIIFSI